MGVELLCWERVRVFVLTHRVSLVNTLVAIHSGSFWYWETQCRGEFPWNRPLLHGLLPSDLLWFHHCAVQAVP